MQFGRYQQLLDCERVGKEVDYQLNFGQIVFHVSQLPAYIPP